MAVDIDDEIMNDFKWLVEDFDLHAVGLYDIDGHEVEGKESIQRRKMKNRGSVCKRKGEDFRFKAMILGLRIWVLWLFWR